MAREISTKQGGHINVAGLKAYNSRIHGVSKSKRQFSGPKVCSYEIDNKSR